LNGCSLHVVPWGDGKLQIIVDPVSGEDGLLEHGIGGQGWRGLGCCCWFGNSPSLYRLGAGLRVGWFCCRLCCAGRWGLGWGETKVVAGVVDDVSVVALAAMARDEAGIVAGAIEELWAGG